MTSLGFSNVLTIADFDGDGMSFSLELDSTDLSNRDEHSFSSHVQFSRL